MRQEQKEKRQSEIEAAAYELLEEFGFEGTSMAMIAKRAKASMETLYNWYGDKSGLFAALVARNATDVITVLEAAEQADGSPKDKVRTTAVTLLTMLTSPRAIALNRAAINDTSGALGALLASSGRSNVGPRLARLISLWKDDGALDFDDLREATAVFISLLVGDHQIRRATGAIPPLTDDEVAARTDRALALFERVYSHST